MRIQMRCVFVAVLVLCGGVPMFANSVSYTAAGTVAPGDDFTATRSGDEIGYFYGSTALYDNVIGVWAGGVQLGSFALNNHTSTFGQAVDFGHVDAGETLVFAIEVLTRGYTVYSDPEMNLDGANHVYTTPFAGQTKKGVTMAAGTFVSFEDLLLPRSNLNYNDEDVVFSDVTAMPIVPEPGSLYLLCAGLALTSLRAAWKRVQSRS